jgi:probable rRNA maturation factor
MPVSVFYRKNQPVQIARLRRCLESLLELSRIKNANVELTLVGEKRIRQMNRRFLKRDRVTDVISFPMEGKPSFAGVPWHLGEIFIATPVARRQAKRAGRNVTAQVIRLGVHGLVHLQGLDHELGAKARRDFEAQERRFLNFLKRKGLCPWDGSLQF